MNDSTGFNPEDDLMKLGNIIVKRSDCSVYGCYRNGVEVLAKDMTKEELNQAHDAVRKHTFDIIGEENKGE